MDHKIGVHISHINIINFNKVYGLDPFKGHLVQKMGTRGVYWVETTGSSTIFAGSPSGAHLPASAPVPDSTRGWTCAVEPSTMHYSLSPKG